MGVSVCTDIIATAESKKMAAMAFANYKRRVSCAANFAQKQELKNKQFAADENKTVNRKWSCDEDGVHISAQWLPIPRVRTFLSAKPLFSSDNPLTKSKSAPSPRARPYIGICTLALASLTFFLMEVEDLTPTVGSPSVKNIISCSVLLSISSSFFTSLAISIAFKSAALISVLPPSSKSKTKSYALLTSPLLFGILYDKLFSSSGFQTSISSSNKITLKLSRLFSDILVNIVVM